MLSEQDIQLKANEYLNILQQNHQKKQQKLKQLEIKVNLSAKIIQKAWRKYILKKKIKKALLIQKTWRKYREYKAEFNKKVHKFKRLYYGIKISNFIFQKYFSQKNKTKSMPLSNNQRFKKQIKIPFSNNLKKYFHSYIYQSELFKSQSKYIKKLRVYQKSKFSQKWQQYEQNLRKQIKKQASKKWVQKDKDIWINQQDKQVNLEDYIEKHMERLFKEQYKKYKQNDQKMEKSVGLLEGRIQYFKQKYWQNMLREANVLVYQK